MPHGVAGLVDAPALFGWSMGAVVAHAVAATLEEEGESIRLVVMVDPPRQTGGALDAASDLKLALAGIGHSHAAPDAAARVARVNIPTAVLKGNAADLFDWCVQQEIIPAEAMTCESFARALALRRRHHAVVSSYRPTRIVAPILVFWAGAVPASASLFEHHSTQVRHDCVDGDHFSLIRSPAIDVIAQRVDAHLESMGAGARLR